jgi:acyl dehydratase
MTAAAARLNGLASGAAAAAWLLLAVAPSAAAAQTRDLEYPVKATYLYKFGPFVEWPPRAFDAGRVNLCVVGSDPFGVVLDRATTGQLIGGRPISVRRLERVGPDSGCHILYVSGSSRQSVADALQAVQGASVLTVTDAASSGPARGIIHFVVQNNRVRFHIDDRAAARNGLGISSKLLNLAVSVRGRG